MSDENPPQPYYVRFTAAKLKQFKQGYETASTNGQRAFYMLSALNMCAASRRRRVGEERISGRPLPGWLHDAISENLAAQLPPVPQKELALVFGDRLLRAEYKAKGVSGYQAEVEAAKALGFYRKKKSEDTVEAEARAVEALRKARSRYREKLRRKGY